MSRKKALIFTLVLFPFVTAGAYFAVLMSFSSIDPSVLESAVEQAGSMELLVAVSMIETVVLTMVCAFFGYILSDKIGLMRSFRFEKRSLLFSLAISVPCGALFSLDAWTFAQWIPELNGYYSSAGTFDAVTWIASVLYGGIAEEVLMRLFFMSLIVFLIRKIFFRRRDDIPTGVFIAANFLSAVLFAAGHLPATSALIGALTPLLILRCFLLNGAAGLVFGELYRRYGIQYAMLAHMVFHLVSRSIWLIAF